MKKSLNAIYTRMEKHYGPTHWWPGDSPFEIAIGAILTQNTAWSNVEKAIVNLKQKNLLCPRRMIATPLEELETAVRPSGYYRQKTKRLLTFCEYLIARHQGSMAQMGKRPVAELRDDLLALNGIGQETADDILLYACEKPIFVVDTYTKRILSRHGLAEENISYHDLQKIFHTNLAMDVALFKEFHGLIVYTGKDFCRSLPRCESCPLQDLL